MNKYELCRWLGREMRSIHPSDLSRATRQIVTLSAKCVEPAEFQRAFTAAGFDKTPPPPPRIDPELWEAREVGEDWSIAGPGDPLAYVEETEGWSGLEPNAGSG
jgi:hypothetical protein